MRAKFTVMLAVTFLTCAGCGNRDESSQQSAQTSVSVPQVDLHAAVYTDDLDLIRQHIEAGSDLNVLEPSRASTPLISAAFLGKTEAAKILVDAGAALDYQNAEGSTALHTAAAFGKLAVAKVLIDAGIDLNIQNNNGSTTLHTAAFFGHVEIVEALLAKGTDQNIRNKDGKTALEIVEVPFEDMEVVYMAVGAGLKPLGLKLNYDSIKMARPKIAEVLKRP